MYELARLWYGPHLNGALRTAARALVVAVLALDCTLHASLQQRAACYALAFDVACGQQGRGHALTLCSPCRATGKCVPFDWVSFTALLLSDRYKGLIQQETRQLYVGDTDSSVLILVDPSKGGQGSCAGGWCAGIGTGRSLARRTPCAVGRGTLPSVVMPRLKPPRLPSAGLPITPVMEENLKGSKFWGEVQSVVDIDRTIMLRLIQYVIANQPHAGANVLSS